MKSIIKSAALPVVAVCMIICLSQTASASGIFRVTDGVHIREKASASSKSLGTVNMDSSVDVLEHNPAGWSKVQAGSITGYIRSDFLKLHIGDAPASFQVTDGVHIREKASTSSKSLGTVNMDSSVDVLEHDPAGWSKVRDGGVEGYIRSDFLKHAGTASQTTSGNTAQTGTADTVIEQRKTAGSDINLRKEASTDSGIIKKLAKDVVVDILADGTNEWSRVIHEGDKGYIRSDLLLPLSAAAQQPAAQTMYTNDVVHLRAKSTKSSSSLRLLQRNTAVEVYETVSSNGETWSKVKHNGTDGYIKSEYLSATQTVSNTIIATMIVTEPLGANVRTGPSQSYSKITSLPYGTTVSVLEHESNGWSRVRTGNSDGNEYIKTDLLGNGAPVELVTMAEIINILPSRQNIRVVDVRTGISYNIRIFSKGNHADYETPTREDTDIMFAIRNGVRSWSARPLWVYVGNRVFAAATHSMPHDVSTIKDNGLDGHLCLHFKDTVTNDKGYQADLRKAVQEAYDKRPR